MEFKKKREKKTYQRTKEKKKARRGYERAKEIEREGER